MKRKDFLKYGVAGVFSTSLGISASAIELSGVNSAIIEGLPLGSLKKEIITNKAMVCASQPLAVSVGYDVLKSGGNAIDASIAVNAMLCLTEPMMCGVGGDLFAVVWNEKERKLYGLNASGRSPYSWSVKEAKKKGLKRIPEFSPLSWTVPGCVSGWDELLKKFGSKNLSELLAPAISYSKEGFAVTNIIGSEWKPERGAKDYSTLNGVYFNLNRKIGPGNIFKNLELAHTFEILARDGCAAYYKGEIAERIVNFSNKHGGQFDLKDFENHKADWVKPVSTNYRGYDVWQLPPNGQGMVVLQMLNVLEQFDIAGYEPNSVEFFHLFLEAKKLCFQDRGVYYADMDFFDLPIKELLSKEYAVSRAKKINLSRAAYHVEPGRIKNSSETVYMTVADEEGNMVSLIQSVYSPWGSHYAVAGLGFTLQNRGALFSLNDGAWNQLEPHKRPFHTIIPSFITQNEEPVFSYGVTGGDFQPQGQVQILMNIIDHKMGVQQAGNQSRLWHRESSEFTNENFAESGKIIAEPEFSVITKQQLIEKGHKFSDTVRYFGGYQGIWRNKDPRTYTGASDPRKDGCSFGY